MVKIGRVLRKFSENERKEINLLISKLIKFDFNGLDIKKLSGHLDTFRVRKGKLRIIYRIINGKVIILDINRRSDTTYKKI